MRSRRSRLTALALAGLLVLAACGDDDDDDDERRHRARRRRRRSWRRLENTGTVNLMSAGEPEEVEAYQEIFDELINAETDYDGRDRVGRRLRGAVPDPRRGRHARRRRRAAARCASRRSSTPARSSRSRTSASTSTSSTTTLGESFVALGEYEGEHYGIPTNINLKSMVWYPKDDFDAAGYEVPETFDELIALSDQIVADGSTPWCVGFESEGATGWPATDWMEDIMLRTAGPDVYDQWVAHEIPFNDPAVVNAGEVFGEIMFADGYVLGGADQHADHRLRRRAAADVRGPAGLLAAPPGELHQRLLPRGRRGRRRLRLVPVPADRPGGHALRAASSPSSAPTATGPRSSTSSSGSSPRTCSARWAACRRRPGSRRTSNVGPDCYANDILADASVILTDALEDGHRAVRRLRPDAGRGRLRQLLDRHDRVHAGRPGLARGRPRRHRGELARRRNRALTVTATTERTEERAAGGTEAAGGRTERHRHRGCGCSAPCSRSSVGASFVDVGGVRLPARRATPTGCWSSSSPSSSASAASSSCSGR